MVAGLAFLSKKNFNPSNLSNQKQVWEAQQRKKQEEARIKDRQEQLQREREDEELAQARGEKTRLRFMYQPPPGMETAKDPAAADDMDNDQTAAVVPESASLTTVHPGDDAAAAAFRRMLAASSAGVVQSTNEASLEKSTSQSISTVLQGSNIERVVKKGASANPNLTALEKEVGRRDGDSGLSLEEQVARFPQLKNAPMAKGMSSTDVNVSFKPLGAQLRNVRCLACGIWGHSRGERECKQSGWNPFDIKRPAAESSVAHKEERKRTRQEDQKVDDEVSTASSDSRGEDSQRERKRRKKSKHKDHRRRKDSRRERRRRRSRSRSPERSRRRRRSRSPSDRRRHRSH